MARTKRGVISRAKHKKVLKSVKGQYGRRKNTIRIARQAMEKAMQYAYRDRKAKKREFRSLWIQRINAGVRAEGLTYAKFINGLAKSKIFMPKLKTKSSAKKRFRFTASGKIKMPQAGKRHGMIKRTNSQIRKQRGTTIMTKQDTKIVKSYMPYNLRGWHG